MRIRFPFYTRGDCALILGWVDMTMQPEQGIGRELGLGEVISKTFEVYRRDFSKYFVLFAVVGVIVQVATALAQQAFVLPTLPVNPTPQQFSSWFSALFATLFLLVAVIFVVNIVFSTIAEGRSEERRVGKECT